MSRWTDLAAWLGSPNRGGAATEQRGVVLHIADGTYDGTVSWLRNPTSKTSAQFVCAKDGRAVQLVDTDTAAWTQVAGNGRWISIENEGHAGDSLTGPQLEFAARVLVRAHQQYGVPLQLADSPSGRGLGWHGMGGSAWGGHTGCPGAPIVAQRSAILAQAHEIIEGDDMGLAGELIEALNNGVTTTAPSGAHCELTVRQIRADNFQVGTTQQLTQIAADAKAGRIAVEALAAAVRAGGGSVDTAAIVAHMDQLAEADRTREEQQLARITDLEEQLRDRDARLAAALATPAGT